MSNFKNGAKKIRFLKDTPLLITSSYKDVYKESEVEYVDLIDETDTHIHVQFENGETSSIPRDSIVYVKNPKTSKRGLDENN